jgi:hypothetical protein
VRYVVAGRGEISDAARERFEDQVDLDLVPATDLLVYRNAVVLPPASVVTSDPALERIVTSGRQEAIQELRSVPASPLTRVDGGWEGPTSGGDLAIVSTEYDGAWEVVGSDAVPERAFGWSTSFRVAGSSVTIVDGGQLPRTIEIALLAALWLVALWITRRPVRR